MARAVELLPGDDHAAERQVLSQKLVTELGSAWAVDESEKLGREIRDPELRASVLLLFAHIARDGKQAADTYQLLADSGALSNMELYRASSTWNGAGRPQVTIDVVEPRLRQGGWFHPAVYAELENAYRAVGRAANARRAASQPVFSRTPSDSDPFLFQGDGPEPATRRGTGFF